MFISSVSLLFEIGLHKSHNITNLEGFFTYRSKFADFVVNTRMIVAENHKRTYLVILQNCINSFSEHRNKVIRERNVMY